MTEPTENLGDTPWVVDVQDAQLHHWHATVLHRVNLRLAPGDVLGLVGRNGAGKSTLIRALLGQQQLTSGRCQLFGKPSDQLEDAQLERLGYAAQQPDLLAWMRVDETLRQVGQHYRGCDPALALQLCALWQLPLDKRCGELSPGQQQALSLVLALQHRPELLVLDEPMSAMDPLARRQFQRALFETAPEGRPRTVLISSHLLSDLERIVSHVAFLIEGQVKLCMPWDEMLERLRVRSREGFTPAGQHVPGLIREREVAPGRVHQLIDLQEAGPGADNARRLTLDDLFEELNDVAVL